MESDLVSNTFHVSPSLMSYTSVTHFYFFERFLVSQLTIIICDVPTGVTETSRRGYPVNKSSTPSPPLVSEGQQRTEKEGLQIDFNFLSSQVHSKTWGGHVQRRDRNRQNQSLLWSVEQCLRSLNCQISSDSTILKSNIIRRYEPTQLEKKF